MGYATIGFPNGLGIKFRIDPQEIGWSFKVKASVIPTVGGRVVQVMGATLSDLTITGQFGEDVSQANGQSEYPGRSWRLATRFSQRIRQMMEQQSIDATENGRMNRTAVFSYPPLDWRYQVYLKDFRDPDGGAITLRPGKFSHNYVLTLFVVQDLSAALVKAGTNNGVFNRAKAQAIDEYIGRISEGIGWEPSKYNGDFGTYYEELFGYTGDVNHDGTGRRGVN